MIPRLLVLLMVLGCGDKVETETDDQGQNTGPVDRDGDGYLSDEDCDDNDDDVHPGAQEICDHDDNDCDGASDEDLGDVYYKDNDGDGYGYVADKISTCDPDEGYVQNGTDCNDENAEVYPGNDEICDGIDNDCDNTIDEDCSGGDSGAE